jgi:hypothetical protein
MMNKLLRLLVLAAVIGAVIWLSGVIFPSPEKAIRARLREIESLVTFPANQAPLTALTEVQSLCSFLSPDVEVRVDALGMGRVAAHGRDEVRQGALTWRNTVNGAKVEFPDIKVVLAADRQTAEVFLNVKARVPTETENVFLEMKLVFQKQGRAWLITRAETNKTLR